MIAGGRGGSGEPPKRTLLDEQTDKLLENICDLCHWPYVYRDDQIVIDEKCSFCPAVEGVQAMKEKLKTQTLTFTVNLDRDAVIQAIDKAILKGDRRVQP